MASGIHPSAVLSVPCTPVARAQVHLERNPQAGGTADTPTIRGPWVCPVDKHVETNGQHAFVALRSKSPPPSHRMQKWAAAAATTAAVAAPAAPALGSLVLMLVFSVVTRGHPIPPALIAGR